MQRTDFSIRKESARSGKHAGSYNFFLMRVALTPLLRGLAAPEAGGGERRFVMLSYFA